MFKQGDPVVHPIRGAGVVKCLEDRGQSGESTQYYRIDLLSQPGSILMIPVEAADDLGLRRAVAQGHLKKVWHILKDDPTSLPTAHKERYQILEEKLRTGDVMQVAEAVRDMAWHRHERGKMTTRGKRIYENGLSLLAGEIAAAQHIEVHDAETQILDKIKIEEEQ